MGDCDCYAWAVGENGTNYCSLHAAAPDLLAALDAGIVLFERVRVYMATLQESDAPLPENVGRLLGDMEAAIAKAKGEA